jgi:uncharacterized protein
MTEPKKRSRAARWLIGLAIASFFLCGIPMMSLAGLAIAGAVPTDIEKLNRRYPAIEDRSGRVLRSGCGLNERESANGCERIEDAPMVEREVAFPSSHPERGLAELRGTFSLPRGLRDRPAAILVHGSGPNCRDQEVPGDLLVRYSPPFPMFRALARELTAQGIAVLRYDKRHCHDYRGYRHDPATFEWSHLTDDARDALDFVASQPEIDPNALIVIGTSEGGQLAPFVAEGDERVAAVLMLAGTTQRFGVGLLGQLERFAALREEQYDFFSALAVRAQASSIRECIGKLDTRGYDPNEQCLGGGVTLRALASFHAYEDRTADVMREMHCPLFAIQGSADINIDPEEIPRMRRILRGRDAEVHRVPSVSHPLTNALSPPDPMAIDAEVLRLIARFLASVKRG